MLKPVTLRRLHANKEFLPRKLDNYLAPGASANCVVAPEDVHVWMTERDPQPNYTRKHHRCVVKILLKGKSVLLLDGRRIHLGEGHGILIFPFQEHATLRDAGDSGIYDTLIVSFSEKNNLDGPLRTLRNAPFVLDEEDAPLLQTVISGCLRRDGRSENDAVRALAWFLSRRLERANTGMVRANSDESPLFAEICDYIQAHLDRAVSLKSLEEHFQISESTLRRIFRKNSHQLTSPGALIRSLKLYKSNELVQNSDASIAEIAKWCGYSDQFAFSRAFKRSFQLSPTQLRIQNRH